MQDDAAFPIASLGDDVCMVAASGELDGSTAWRLQDALGSARASGARRLIADFAAVTYFDADALTVLAACATHIQREGASLVVVTRRSMAAPAARGGQPRRRRRDRALAPGGRGRASRPSGRPRRGWHERVTEELETASPGGNVPAPVPPAQRADPLDRRRSGSRRRVRVRQRRVLRAPRSAARRVRGGPVASRRGSS